MTKKHFEIIAETIKEVYEYQKDNDGKGSRDIKQGAIRVTAENLANAFKGINPNFDENRFLSACGIIKL